MADPLDERSPYYLSPSDDPGDVLVPHLLSPNGENYQVWSRLMWHVLRAKNKWGFVDGTLTKPEEDALEFTSWEMCDAMVMSWISNAVDSTMYGSIIFSDSAKEMWDGLRVLFYRGNPFRIHQIKADISGFRQGGLPVAMYYARLMSMWAELDCYANIAACGCKLPCEAAAGYAKERNSDRVHQFLMGLNPDKFRRVTFQILNSEHLPSLHEVYSMVSQEEQLKQLLARPAV